MAEFGEQSAWDAKSGAHPADETKDESLADELRALIAAGRRMAAAEFAYQSTRARLMGRAVGWIAAAGALALALAFFVLMALVVGLLLALAPLIGAWGAMGAVVGGLLVATLSAGLVVRLNLRRLLALIRGEKDPA